MSDSKNSIPNVLPSGDKRVKKARRTKVLLIIVLIVLVATLGGLVYLAYPVIFSDDSTGSQTTIKDPTGNIVIDLTDKSAPGEIHVQETSIPNLVSLFGLTIEEANATLGDSFQLVKTDAATDATNPDIKQLATFSYEPVVEDGYAGSMSGASLPSEHIYLSLDESGRVIDVYYTCDMRLLGYPVSSFVDLVSGEMVSGALATAGVEPRDFGFEAPAEENTISYDNANSENRKIIKQSTIFSGRTLSDGVPTAWTLTVTYDYGAGVSSTAAYKQAIRTISLRLA